jgi:Flp pilus assembly protein TadG
MVETAIILPLLLLLVFGIIQFGILFKDYMALTDAVRAGARQAAVSRELADPVGTATARVQSAAADLDLADLSVAVTSSWAPGEDVTVTATYPYSIDLLGLVVKSGFLSSTTTERVE